MSLTSRHILVEFTVKIHLQERTSLYEPNPFSLRESLLFPLTLCGTLAFCVKKFNNVVGYPWILQTHTNILFRYFVWFKYKHLLVSIYRSIDDVVNTTTRVWVQKSEGLSLDYRSASYSLSIGRPLPQGKRLEIIADHSLFSFAELTHCGRVTKISVFNTVKLGTSASSS
jgi:hypothetical protein